MLEDFNTKLNFQGTQSNSGVLHYWTNDKIKTGRGAGPNRSPEDHPQPDHPGRHLEVRGHPHLRLQLLRHRLWSNNDGVFNAAPQGGRDADVYWDADGTLHGSYWDFAQNGKIDQWRLDASYFFNSGATSHELKFGGGFREQENLSSTVWPGNKMVYSCELFRLRRHLGQHRLRASSGATSRCRSPRPTSRPGCRTPSPWTAGR